MEQELKQSNTSTTDQSQNEIDKLAGSFFGGESGANTPVNEVKAVEATAAPVEVTPKSEPENKVADVTTLLDSELKTNLGFDTWDDAKKQFEELKTLKEATSTKEEIKFANEQSKKFFELLKEGKEDDLYSFLSEKKKIEKFTSVEVNNETAEDIIKLSIATKNKNLSSKEIDFLYKQDYVTPKEPTQRVSETDEEFEERVTEWKEKSEIVEMKRMVAAKMAQPELEKLKIELVLPDIHNNQPEQNQPTQEELDNWKKVKEDYLKSADTVVKELNELNITVKDEDVDVPLSYTYSAEEKKLVADQMQELAEKNFNVTSLFDKRWSNADGSINTNQIARDLALLNSGDKAIQKLSNDAASKIKLKYIQEKSNIKLNGNSSSGTFNPQSGQSPMDELAKKFFVEN